MRTEEEFLKDFKKLGYDLNKNYKSVGFIYLEEEYNVIHINFFKKQYSKSFGYYDSAPITMAEHKLLNELFEIWGWL